METRKIVVKRRVWVGLGCAVAATAGWWMWTRNEHPAPAPTVAASRPFVRLTGVGNTSADQILRERADLLDPTPLFFPTEWNYGQRPLPASLRRQPGQVFGSYDSKPTFTEQELTLTPPEALTAPDGPAGVLALGNAAPFAGFGHVDVPREPLRERSAYVEVRGFSADKPVIEQALAGLAVPRPDFSPVEFIVAVSAAGVVGEPVLASGSGWEEVDAFFRTYLVKTMRLGQRLNPGQYRVVIGP